MIKPAEEWVLFNTSTGRSSLNCENITSRVIRALTSGASAASSLAELIPDVGFEDRKTKVKVVCNQKQRPWRLSTLEDNGMYDHIQGVRPPRPAFWSSDTAALFLPMAFGPPAAADRTVRPSQAAASQDAGLCLNVTSAFPDHQSRVATISSAPLCSGPLQGPSHLCCVLHRLAPSPHKLQSVMCLLHAVFAPLEG